MSPTDLDFDLARSLPPISPRHAERPSVLMATSVLSSSSRIRAEGVFRHLGWPPGAEVRFTVEQRVATLRLADNRRPHAVIKHPGHVHIPPAPRHAAGLSPGDTVLLVAVATRSVLAILSPGTVHALLAGVLALPESPR